MAGIAITSLRGGMNDADMPDLLGEHQCANATNVEFFMSALGERRLGCGPFDMTGAGAIAEAYIAALTEWYPLNVISSPEFWAVGATPADPLSGTTMTFSRRSGGVWGDVVPDDTPAFTTNPHIFNVAFQGLNGKLFIAYESNEDRMHVWDGTYLRRAGLAQPAAAPTVADTGAGTFSTTRYYRVRFVEQDADGNVLRRSEPSDAVEFSPSGTGSAARITRPAAINERETHWEVEASSDNADFFLIATVAIATTTYDDSTDLSSTSYAIVGTASEEIGTYLLQQAAKFLIADGNRLITAGSWSHNDIRCRVWWTPVFADPGVGNDERVPLSTGGDNYIDLDNGEGGVITGMSSVTAGAFYVFKWGAVYRFLRTGDVSHAYDVTPISKARGAMPGSMVNGLDQDGRPAIFFLDPSVGPCMLGGGGLRRLHGLRKLWRRVSVGSDTEFVTRGVYYPDKQQVHWWIAVDGAGSPNLKIVLQVNEIRDGENGVLFGSFALADGLIATAYAVAIWHETTTEGEEQVERTRARPFIGLAAGADVDATEMVQRCDVYDDDNGVAYTASITTRPYLLGGTLNDWGVMVAGLLASASATAQINLSLVRDYGKETITKTITFVPDGSEDYVTAIVDDLVMAEAKAIQLTIADA